VFTRENTLVRSKGETANVLCRAPLGEGVTIRKAEPETAEMLGEIQSSQDQSVNRVLYKAVRCRLDFTRTAIVPLAV
jgi:hypothetical protein